MENLSGTLDREALDRVAPALGDEARQARMHELRREILALAGEYAILQTAPRFLLPVKRRSTLPAGFTTTGKWSTSWGPAWTSG